MTLVWYVYDISMYMYDISIVCV